jgi:hypothetical protein
MGESVLPQLQLKRMLQGVVALCVYGVVLQQMLRKSSITVVPAE